MWGHVQVSRALAHVGERSLLPVMDNRPCTSTFVRTHAVMFRSTGAHVKKAVFGMNATNLDDAQTCMCGTQPSLHNRLHRQDCPGERQFSCTLMCCYALDSRAREGSSTTHRTNSECRRFRRGGGMGVYVAEISYVDETCTCASLRGSSVSRCYSLKTDLPVIK